MIMKLTAAVLATTMFTTQVWAGCMDGTEKAALKIETLQQELMVAALICSDANPYNAFVLANRPELMSSDHALQAFYTKLYSSEGTAQFQAVKTRLANHFSLDSLHDQQGFCHSADALFAGMRNGSPLATQVSWVSVNDTKESCERGAPIVETVDGGAASLPQITRAPAQQEERVAQNNSNGPPPAQRATRASYNGNYSGGGGYYPPPNPYWQTPAYNYPPQGYYRTGW